MTTDNIDFGHFFSTMPNDEWERISDTFDELRTDIRTGVYYRIATIYGATTYSDYLQAAILYYQNLPELQQQYPELFI